MTTTRPTAEQVIAALEEVCKGTSIMLSTALRDYAREPWAERIRAALDLARKWRKEK